MFYGSKEVNGERGTPEGEIPLEFPEVKNKVRCSGIFFLANCHCCK